jgi:hypothetical protein
MKQYFNTAIFAAALLLLSWLLFGWGAYRAKPVTHWVIELRRERTRTVLKIGHDTNWDRVALFAWTEDNRTEGEEKIIVDRGTRTIPFGKLESIDMTTLPGGVAFTFKEVSFVLGGHSVRMRGVEYDLAVAPVVTF